MALNFLLGFTGVLSFGHAACGLGAYGTALTIKYLYPSTPVGMLVGVVVSTAAAAAIGPMIARLRGEPADQGRGAPHRRQRGEAAEVVLN